MAEDHSASKTDSSPGVLQACLDHLEPAIFALDREFRYTCFNRSHAQVMKALYGVDIRLGMNLLDCQTVEADRAQAEANLRRTLAGEEVVTEGFSGEPDSRRSFEIRHTPLQDRTGACHGVLVVAQDISERKRIQASLAASQGRFQAMFDQSASGVLEVQTRTGRILNVNQSFCDITGFDRTELLGMHVQQLLPPGEHADGHAAFALPGHGAPRADAFETRAVRRDGQEVWLSVQAAHVTLDGMQENTHLSFIQDVTARHVAEAQLRQQELEYRAAFEQGALGLAQVSLEGRFMRVNHRFCDLLGYPPEALIGQHFQAFTHPDDRALSATQLSAVQAVPVTRYRFQKRYIRRDGGTIWMEVSGTKVLDQTGSVMYLLSAFEDITQRKAQERVIQEEQEKQRMIFWTLPDMVWLKDLEGVYRFCNPRFETLVGRTEAQIQGRTDHDLFDPETARWFQDHDRKALEADQPSRNEEWVTFSSDGHRELLETIKTPLRGADGHVVGILGIARDITRIREDQERLRKLSRAIEQNPDVVVITDRAGVIEYVNPRFGALTGYAEAEALGQTMRILKSGVTPLEVYADLWGTILAGRTWQGELQNRKKSGELYWEATAVAPILDDAGTITHFVSIKHDISRRKQIEASLQESQEHYRLLFENMHQGAFFQRADGVLTDVNPAALAMLGLSRDQFLGRTSYHPDWKVIRPDGSPLPPEEHGSTVALRTGAKVEDMELGVYRPDTRTYAWLVVNVIPQFRPGESRPFQVFATLHDITERKRVEQESSRQRSLLDTTGRVARVGGWEIDLTTGGLTWTPETYRIHELEPGLQPSVESAIDFYTPESRPVIAAAVQRAIDQGEPFDLELQIITAKGNRRWVRAVGEVVRQDGKAAKVRGAFQDIHASRTAREALAESHALNEMLLETIPFPMDIVDEKGRILFMSRLMEQVVGPGWQDQSCWALYKDDHEPCTFCPLRQPIDVGRTFTIETSGVLGGRVFAITHTGLVFKGQKALMEIFIDITERKRTEEERLRQLDELRRWQEVTLGRESRVADLKREVNALLESLGRPPRYRAVATEPPPEDRP